MFESYPQLIMGIYLTQGLQLKDPLNIVSCTLSAVSVVYGLGDYLSFIVNRDQAGAPFKITCLGILTIAIDSLFRAVMMAYLCFIVKGYALLVGPIYVLLVLIGICIKKRTIQLDSEDCFGTLISLGCSAHENADDEYAFR